MTPREGQKKIARLLGPKAGWRDSRRPTNAEARAEAQAQALAAAAEHTRLQAERDALQRRLLADPEYQSVAAACKAVRAEKDRLSGEARRFRLTVGRTDHGFFLIEAEGDNWADVVRKLEAKKGGVA